MPLNWDELFAYTTVKMVKIRDRRLGMLHYLFMLLVLLYVGGWTVLYQMRYIITESPVGSIRVSLLQGATPKPVNQLPYCLTPNQTKVNGYPNYACTYWDESFVVFPETEEFSMFATSRVTISNQSVGGCSLVGDSTCKYATTGTETLYIGDIEHFTLLIDHTVYAPTVGIEANARDMGGEVLDSKNKVVKNLAPPNIVGVKGSSDILELGALLNLAGVPSLDGASGTNANISLRYDGIVIIVFISYSNTFTYSLSALKYTLSMVTISATKFKAVQPIFTKDITTRILWNRHGIRMIFLQEGQLGKFDFQTLLLSFVSGLGLITVSTVFVDLIAFYIMKPRATYREHRYEITEVLAEPRYTAIT